MTYDIDPILAKVRFAIPIAKWFAQSTESLWDDEAVKVLEAASTEGSPLLTLLRTILNDPAVLASSGSARTAAIEAAMGSHKTDAVAGIPWAVLLTYLPQVVTLLLTLFGKRR